MAYVVPEPTYDSRGRIDTQSGYQKLKIYHVRTGRSRTVVRGKFHPSMAWTPQGTLLFSGAERPSEGPRPSSVPSYHAPRRPPSPDVYEVVPNDTPKLLIKHAYAPSPSPDGKWIAFYGLSELPKADNPSKLPDAVKEGQKADPPPLPEGMQTYLFERATGKRTFISDSVHFLYLWTPDSQELVYLRSGETTPALPGQPEAQSNNVGEFFIYNLNQQKEREFIAGFSKDYKAVTHRLPVFQFLSWSSDGQWAIVAVNTTPNAGTGFLYPIETKLIAVNIKTEEVVTLGELGENKGVAWFAPPAGVRQ